MSRQIVNYDTVVQNELGQINIYAIVVLLTCELGSLSVTGSLVASSTYFSLIPGWSCNDSVPTTNDSCNCIRHFYTKPNGFNTFAARFDMVCSREYLTVLLASLVMVGRLIGSVGFGHFADCYGRKLGAIVSLTGNTIASLLFAYVPNLWLSCVLGVVSGFFGGGYTTVASVMLIEFIGTKYRMLVSSFHGRPYGLMYMALVGVLTRDWQYYLLAMAATAVPFSAAWFYLAESPRWLIRQNRIPEAVNVIAKIQKFNCKTHSFVGTRKLEALYAAESQSDLKTKNYSYLDLCRYPEVRRNIILMIYLWFSGAIISWGVLNIISRLTGFIYLNLFFVGLLQALFGFLPLILSYRIGRRPTMLIGLGLTSVAMWSAGGIQAFSTTTTSSLGTAITVFVVIGTGSLEVAWKINHLAAREIFPTVIRSKALGLCSAASSTASIIAPQIAYLNHYFLAAPYIIFGTISLIQFCIAFFLPETKGMPLPDVLLESRNEQSQLLVNEGNPNSYGSVIESAESKE